MKILQTDRKYRSACLVPGLLMQKLLPVMQVDQNNVGLAERFFSEIGGTGDTLYLSS